MPQLSGNEPILGLNSDKSLHAHTIMFKPVNNK
jgi:hypothetical protein